MSQYFRSYLGPIALSLISSAAVASGCGGDKSSPTGGTSGSGTSGASGSGTSGSGTSGSGTSGASGSGTSGSGTGGASGSGTSGASGASGSDGCSRTPPPNDAITDFTAYNPATGTWGDPTMTLTGSIFSYASPTSTFMQQVDTSAGNLHLTGTVDAMGYAGVGLAFGPCTDASQYTGISFDITGGAAIGSIVVQLQTHSDNDPAVASGTRGKCDPTASTCRNPQTSVTIAADGTINLPFAMFMGGSPVATVDPSELWAVQFQFGGKTAAYTVDVTIDNVHFTM